jgi:hypothetical protein
LTQATDWASPMKGGATAPERPATVRQPGWQRTGPTRVVRPRNLPLRSRSGSTPR